MILGFIGTALLKPYHCEENLHHSNKHPEGFDVEDIEMDLYLDWFYTKPPPKGSPYSR
jgi:hypothetical protein